MSSTNPSGTYALARVEVRLLESSGVRVGSTALTLILVGLIHARCGPPL